jgi:exopolysaccharide biosynthesis predicted pyruvyltransferase EpsI
LNAFHQVIRNAIEPHVRPGPYALVDYPNYLNPGDCAIWLGTRRLLEELHGAPPVYVSTLRNFSVDRCMRRLGDGTVYFKGGGNMGGIYSKHDLMRRKILAALSGRRIVILPQSIAESNGGYAEAGTLGLLRHRPDWVLFARDRLSKAAFEDRLGRTVPLCPDLCHMLPFELAGPGEGTTLLVRRDPELKTSTLAPQVMLRDAWDWNDIAMLRIWNKLGKLPVSAPNGAGRSRLQDLVARAKMEHAIKRLAKHATVVTDRLHGMILAQAIGRRVIALDNLTGKVAAYRQTWSDLLPGVSIAASLEEAISQASSE